MNAPAFIGRVAAARFEVLFSRDLEEVKEAWLALEAEEGAGTLFQHFELMRLWYGALEPSQGVPLIAVVRCGHTGRPVALFPMVSRRRALLRWLEIADGGVIDYCQPLLSPSRVGPHNINAIMKALRRALPGDVLYINKVPDRVGGRPNPLNSLPQRTRLSFSSWLVPLAGNAFELTVRPRQSANYRSLMGRRSRKLEREHGRNLRLVIGEELSSADFDLLCEMRAQWFVREGRDDVLASSHWRGFYQALAQGEGGPVQPWLSRLDTADETIAVVFGLLDRRGAVVLLPASKRDSWNPFAPGAQLFDATMELFSARGTAAVDLSIGDNPYKERLGAEQQALYDFLFAASPLGSLYYAFWRVKVSLRSKAWLRRLLRKP